MKHLFLYLSLVLTLSAQTYTATPIANGNYSVYPYNLTGLLTVNKGNGSYTIGSGAVVKNPKLVLTCAHIVFDNTAIDPWYTNVTWYRAWSSSTFPSSFLSGGQTLRGYYRFTGYSTAAKADMNSAQSFGLDFTVQYAYEDTAQGNFADMWDNGIAALKTSSNKLITGYPSGLYGSANVNKFVMHQTGPYTRAFSAYTTYPHFLQITELSTGPGNSGGPAWVSNGTKFMYAGTLVGGLERSLGDTTDQAAVYGIDSTVLDMINSAIGAASPNAPPSITSQPTSRRVKVGDSVTFTVVATGSNLAYKWTFNGNTVANASSNTLTLPSVLSSQAGTYQVEVSNPSGIINSNPVTLTVDILPTIITQPISVSGTTGQSVSLTVITTGATSYQWMKNGTSIPNATGSIYAIQSLQASDAGSYSVNISNSAGTITSSVVSVTVILPPVITVQPISRTVSVGTNITFSVVATGTGTLTYTWYKDGVSLGISGPSLSLLDVQTSQAGNYYVQVSNAYGTTTSLNAGITVLKTSSSTAGLPVITHPVGKSIYYGQTTTLTITATGVTSYQWLKGGVPINGASSAVLTLNSTMPSDTGSYTVNVSNSTGTITSNPAQLIVLWSRISNLSVRTNLALNRTLIVGFVSNGSRQLLVRAVGPGLSAFGLNNFFPDPIMSLMNQSGVRIGGNDNWDSTISPVFNSVGAFGLPFGSRDAAVVQSISGPNTALVGGTGSGVVLVEVYDTQSIGLSKLSNVSARNFVGIGSDILIAGFVIEGNTVCNLLIRGVGPGLGDVFGMSGFIVDPKVELFNQTGVKLVENDSWSISLNPVFDKVGAFRLTNNSLDAALQVALQPGVYTVQLSGVSGTTGEGLIEVYEIPQ